MPRLSAEHVVVRFGGLLAVNDVTIEVEAGRVLFDGVDITGKSPYKRARMGIARTFQKLEAFSSLSVRDNVLVAAEQRRAWDRSGFSPAAVTEELLERVGLAGVANYMVGTLPTGTARLSELARALATDPKVLLLDEPSSGLNEEETQEVAGMLRALAADGLAVLLVEHDMSLVMGTCETIDVLDFGNIIFQGTPREVQLDPAVRAAYLGSADTKAAG